ncbi:response regulator transcription factor [Roseateles sp. NT4]|uniref:response regulator transcription factor n=1 Tax=Roseateles sp. NT4 TaxID=3453715 RepID=UPI003EE9ED47
MPNLLLLEDDVQLGATLTRVLTQSGFFVHWRRLARDVSQAVAQCSPTLVILDLQLPDGSGLDVLRNLRAEGHAMPVLMLTIRDSVGDRVQALDEGADDYVLKPFATAELISRIHALIRRSAGQAAPVWTIGALSIHPQQQWAKLNDRLLELSPREFQLLHALARNAGRVLSRPQLEAAVSHNPERIGSNVLDVHVFNLRRKIGESFIRTVRGVGYMLQSDA